MDPIILNPDQRAALRFPNRTVQYKTLGEALAHWQQLQPDVQEHAVLVTQDQRVFQSVEFDRIRLTRLQ